MYTYISISVANKRVSPLNKLLSPHCHLSPNEMSHRNYSDIINLAPNTISARKVAWRTSKQFYI